MNDFTYTKRYGQISQATPRSLARSAALRGFYLRDRFTGALDRGLERNRVHFIYLHHVMFDEQDSFRAMLSKLSERHQFISYSEAVDRIVEDRIDGRYITFSFDDGLKSCTTAAQILEEFGATSCFFVCPTMVGLQDPRAVEEFCRTALSMPPVELLDWSDIENLLSSGHEIGSHGQTHSDLATLSEAQLQDEIGGSFKQLGARLGGVRHFAWPFGRFQEFSATAGRLVFENGFESCASAVRGAHVADAGGKDLCIRREHTLAAAPLSQLLYFLAKSSRNAGPDSGKWPDSWRSLIG